jgi:hypothetical protein
MKQILTLLILSISIYFTAFTQNDSAIFLHHSTGGNVFSAGNVSTWINDFNTGNGTDYYIKERSYPKSPWPWSNYPYDYWKLWIDGACNNDEAGIECLESIVQDYELVIYKHCFPGAGIAEPDGTPDITSSKKTVENYKLQYRALRDMMDNMPTQKFMLWTLAPLHRLATNHDQAGRAHEFVEWIKNDFLTEDGKEHPNIYIFDFYGLVAQLDPNTTNNDLYCLKYEYEGSHSGSDSHPNTAANEYVGPFFARAVVDALADTLNSPNKAPDLSTLSKPEICKGSVFDLADLVISDANNTDATYTYHSGSPALPGNELDGTVVGPTTTTTYYILGKTEAGLSDELPVEVVINESPDLNTSTAPEIKAGNSYDLADIEIQDANHTGASYSYHSGSPALSANKLENTTVSPSETSTYYILGDNNGCQDELAVTVAVSASNPLKVGNVKSDKQFSIYPVPVENVMEITLSPSAKISEIEIISIDGKTVMRDTQANGKTQFDVRTLQKGMYILKVVINNKPMVESFIKK